MADDDAIAVPDFPTFSAYEIHFKDSVKPQSVELVNRILNNQIGPSDALRKIGRQLDRLYKLEQFGQQWFTYADAGQVEKLPRNFNRVQCTYIVGQLCSLEVLFEVAAIDLHIFANAVDGAKECYKRADEAIVLAQSYLRKLEGNPLLRWWTVIKRRILFRKSPGIEDLRKQLEGNRSILAGYASILSGVPGLDLSELHRQVDQANETLQLFVRGLHQTGEADARRHSVNILVGRLAQLLELQGCLVPLGASFATRRAMASLMISVAYLHWALAISTRNRDPLFAQKQLLYAKKAVEESQTSYSRAMQLILTTPGRLLFGTYQSSQLPEWRRMLPKGRELRSMQRRLRRRLSE